MLLMLILFISAVSTDNPITLPLEQDEKSGRYSMSLFVGSRREKVSLLVNTMAYDNMA